MLLCPSLVLLIILVIIYVSTCDKEQYSGWDAAAFAVKNHSKYAEEPLTPRKETVMTTLDQCVSLCTTDGNRPGVITYWNLKKYPDVHDTERCVMGCKQFVKQHGGQA